MDRMQFMSISGYHLLCEVIVSDPPNVFAFINATKDDDRFFVRVAAAPHRCSGGRPSRCSP